MFLIGSLALIGFPFLSGFYSKDIILEMSFAQYSVVSLFAYWLGVISAFFTAFYSFRLIYLTFLAPVNAKRSVIQVAHESSIFIILPLLVLSLGSLFSGYLTRDLFVGLGSVFFGNSIFVLPKNFNLVEAEFLPLQIKLLPLVFSLSGMFLALFLNIWYQFFLVYLKKIELGRTFYIFFNQKWFFDKLYNQYLVKPFFDLGFWMSFLLLDKGFIEFFGPSGIAVLFQRISKKVSIFQTGLIYHYTFVILLGVFFYINLLFIFQALYLIFQFDIIMYYCFMLLAILL